VELDPDALLQDAASSIDILFNGEKLGVDPQFRFAILIWTVTPEGLGVQAVSNVSTEEARVAMQIYAADIGESSDKSSPP
jgi:hypothetical protein